jgi:hypothetical protein
MRRSSFSILFIALFLGCAGRALVKGALTPEERLEYVEQTGALIPQRLKSDFIEGKASEGMTKEMVIFLYGQPDRTENNRYGIDWGRGGMDTAAVVDLRDSLWNYFGSDSVSIKRGLIFNGDTLSRIIGETSR